MHKDVINLESTSWIAGARLLENIHVRITSFLSNQNSEKHSTGDLRASRVSLMSIDSLIKTNTFKLPIKTTSFKLGNFEKLKWTTTQSCRYQLDKNLLLFQHSVTNWAYAKRHNVSSWWQKEKCVRFFHVACRMRCTTERHW